MTYGSIQLIRQSSMSTTIHHGAYHELTHRVELSGKRAVDCRIAQTHSDVGATVALALSPVEIDPRTWRTYYADTTSKNISNVSKAWIVPG